MVRVRGGSFGDVSTDTLGGLPAGSDWRLSHALSLAIPTSPPFGVLCGEPPKHIALF
ncbi:MAG: hypothetical protein LBD93_06075 [Treponema sp.]|nr:hypothetical protein [Treponema sp.]